jgi:hypothetical protein
MTKRRLGPAVLTACAAAAAAGALAAASPPRAATASSVPASTLSCQQDPCYSPQQFRVAYGIQPLVDSGIDGRGETVTVLDPAALPSDEPTDIRQDFKSFDGMFALPAARIEIATSLAGSASPWQATEEEVNDAEIVHAVAPAATLRVVLFPSSWAQSPANATADMLAALRLGVSHTDVVSISWSLGEHYFTKAQVAELHSVLLGADADHVTVIGSSGNGGSFPTPRGWGGQLKEVSLPALRPARAGRWRHHAERESQDRRLHRRERLERLGRRLQPPLRPPRLSGRRPGPPKGEGRARRGR